MIFEVSDEPTSCTAEAVEKSGKWCGKGPEFELMDTPGDMTHLNCIYYGTNLKVRKNCDQASKGQISK